jgi:RNAse (barnase) inhibitor barstar
MPLPLTLTLRLTLTLEWMWACADLNRAGSWCLWEILAAVLHGVPLTITMPQQARAQFVADLSDRFGDIVRVFSAVSSENAEAQEVSDRTMIHEAIRKTIGFAKLDECVRYSRLIYFTSSLLSKLSLS